MRSNSLGSVLFPTKRPELIDHLVASLLAAEPPLHFIFALAAAGAVLSAETIRAVEISGRGLLCSWVPQKTVLVHPVTSFFIVCHSPYVDSLFELGSLILHQTHAGAGSAYEAIMSGLPMVTVPQLLDQPTIAAFRGLFRGS